VDTNGKSQQIMQAAERLFTSRRFHEITMEDVAREAGVGKGTLYRYFRDKDDLFFQTATSGFDELCELLRKKVPDNASFAEQLLIACRQISRFFEHRRQLSRMMQSEEGRVSWCAGSLHQRWTEHRKRLVAAVADMVRKGVAEGEVREDIAAEALASFLLGMLRTRGRDLGEVPQDMRQHEVVVDLFCRGVARRDQKPGDPTGLSSRPEELKT
jgi:AcrR family transcriptional regulator